MLKPLAAASGATAWILAYRGAPSVFDEWLALPIALETALPGTFPKGDLLVQGSISGPFHLYKLASVLWTLGIDVDVAWYVLLAVSLMAFFLAVWRVGRAMGLDDRERMLLVMAIAATPMYRGTLNWSAQPMLSFITASVAVPVGLLAVAAAIESRSRTALLLAALAFDIHPSIGICAGLAVLSVVPWRLPVKRLLTEWGPAALVAAPNLAYLLLHRPAPFSGSNARLWAEFQIFGYHTFVRDHWRDGYPWYALALALAIIAASQLGALAARRARGAAIALTVAAAAWIVIMNYAPIPALMPLYLIRASLLAKPLILGLALTALTRRRYVGKYAFIAPWAALLAVAHPDRLIAEGALAIILGIVLRPSDDRRLAAAGAAAWTVGILSFLAVLSRQAPLLDGMMEPTSPLRVALLVVGLATVGLLIVPRTEAEGVATVMRGKVALPFAVGLLLLSVWLDEPFGRGWLPESPTSISQRLHLSRPLRKEAGVMRWALLDSPRASLFAIPPVDAAWLRFRLAARRGAYVTVHDINQLWYVRNFVFPAVDRLSTLGVVVKGPHNVDPRPYLRPTCERLRQMTREGVDFYVLPQEAVAPPGSVLSYRDADYSVLDVRRTVVNCHE